VTKPLPAAEREKRAAQRLAQRDEARRARHRLAGTVIQPELRLVPVAIEEVVAAWFFGRPVASVRAHERRLVAETLGCLS
jgi:hypothetical protein